MKITIEQLVQDIKSLGIKDGDMLFVRISYKAIGDVEGGADTVIDAILQVIGKEGTLIASAFYDLEPSYKKYFKKRVYQPGKMKLITGIIPKLMANRPNAYFSSNPVTPYVVIGAKAEEITNIHTPETEGYYLIRYIISNYNPKCLRIGGVELVGTTHLAFTEGLKATGSYQKRVSEGIYYKDQNGKLRWYERTSSAFCRDSFKSFYYDNIYTNKDALIASGTIGKGKAVVTDMKVTYAIEKSAFGSNPLLLSCENPNCVFCRASFSYSKPGLAKHLMKQIVSLVREKAKRKHLYNIKECLIILFGNKCQ